MLDAPMIQTGGFRNHEGGGVQLQIRLPYYRGIWTNLIRGATVTIDGSHYDAQSIRWQTEETELTFDELTGSTTTRWPADQAATLFVPAAEALDTGFHDVSVELSVEMSYIPEELAPTTWREKRRLVITQ